MKCVCSSPTRTYGDLYAPIGGMYIEVTITLVMIVMRSIVLAVLIGATDHIEETEAILEVAGMAFIKSSIVIYLFGYVYVPCNTCSRSSSPDKDSRSRDASRSVRDRDRSRSPRRPRRHSDRDTRDRDRHSDRERYVGMTGMHLIVSAYLVVYICLIYTR